MRPKQLIPHLVNEVNRLQREFACAQEEHAVILQHHNMLRELVSMLEQLSGYPDESWSGPGTIELPETDAASGTCPGEYMQHFRLMRLVRSQPDVPGAADATLADLVLEYQAFQRELSFQALRSAAVQQQQQEMYNIEQQSALTPDEVFNAVSCSGSGSTWTSQQLQQLQLLQQQQQLQQHTPQAVEAAFTCFLTLLDTLRRHNRHQLLCEFITVNIVTGKLEPQPPALQASLLRNLSLTKQQHRRISNGFMVLHRLLQRAQAQRLQIQQDLKAIISKAQAHASASPGNELSWRDQMAELKEQQQQMMVDLGRWIQKETTLADMAGYFVLDSLTWQQKVMAVVQSHPYVFRPMLLGQEVLVQQESVIISSLAPESGVLS